MFVRVKLSHLVVLVFSIFIVVPILAAPYYTLNQDSGVHHDYGHMAKKIMNDIFDETGHEFSKAKHEEEISEEKNDFGDSLEEIVPKDFESRTTADDKKHHQDDNQFSLFVRLLIKILEELFGDSDTPVKDISATSKDPKELPKISPIQSTEIPRTAAEETPRTTAQTMEVPQISKLNIAEVILKPSQVSATPTSTTTTDATTTIPEHSEAVPPPLTATATTPAVSVPHIPKMNPEVPLHLPITPPPTSTPTTPVSMVSFEVPQIPKMSIPQLPTKPTTEEPSTTPPNTSLLPPSIAQPTKSTSIGASEAPPLADYESKIPFWLRVIDGIRCSLKDCEGVLIPTISYDRKELKNLTLTRFVRNHGLPPCPCIEMRELQKAVMKETEF